jgi:hypothetical protein
VVVGWRGKRCVSVWYDVIIVENAFVEACETVEVYFDRAGVLLFDHIPKYSGFMFKYFRELEL